MITPRKILSLQCAGFGHNLLELHPQAWAGLPLAFTPLTPLFPAVTCTAQATIRTAETAEQHGIVANGRYDHDACRVEFWSQSARLVKGPRIWENTPFRTAMLFHQQSLGERCAIVVNPAPVHKHHGGMIQACHTQPPELEAQLNQAVGTPFNLMRYWGPLAGLAASRWITRATAAIMRQPAPELILTYLPHLDYAQQKWGPAHPRVGRACAELAALLQELLHAADNASYDVVIWGDYAITPASRVVYPNRALRQAGLFQTRTVGRGLTYPNLYDSRAFAMADHQIAHVYVHDPGDIPAARACLERLPGVGRVAEAAAFGLPAQQSGNLVLQADPDAWFAYPWWENPREAPDYASHVDIHSKIGFDPCELFWNIPLLSTATDATLPRGTHGRTDTPAVLACAPALNAALRRPNLLQFSRALAGHLAGFR